MFIISMFFYDIYFERENYVNFEIVTIGIKIKLIFEDIKEKIE